MDKHDTRTRSFETNLRTILRATEATKTSDLKGRIEIKEFKDFPDGEGCRFCSQEFKNGALTGPVGNDDPATRLPIGIDCAAKLERFNQTGVLSVSEREIERYRKGLSDQLYKRVMLPGKSLRSTAMTVRKWFEEHYAELPMAAKTAFDWIRRYGYPPTPEHAEVLVKHYQAACVVEVESVLLKAERELYRAYRDFLDLPCETLLGQLEDDVLAQLKCAEAEVRLRWAPVLAELKNGVKVARKSVNFTYGPFEFKHKGFTITSYLRYRLDDHIMLETMPEQIRVAEVEVFTPRRQQAQVRLDPRQVDEWLARADARYRELQQERQEAAERTARKAEQERRNRIDQLLQQPLRLDDYKVQTPPTIEGFDLYIEAQGAKISMPVDGPVAGPKMYLATKPEQIRFTVESISTDYRTVKLKAWPPVLELWHANARERMQHDQELNLALLKNYIEEEAGRPGGSLRMLDFKPEIKPTKRWDRKDYEVLVHRRNGASFHLSFDDSYRLEEGPVLVWLNRRFSPGSSAYLVNRVTPRVNRDGSASLVYRRRMRGFLDPVEIPVKTIP